MGEPEKGSHTIAKDGSFLLLMPDISLMFFSSSARKEGASSPVSGKDFDMASLSKTQLIPSSKDGDLKDVLARERETSSIEPVPSDSPREESRAPRYPSKDRSSTRSGQSKSGCGPYVVLGCSEHKKNKQEMENPKGSNMTTYMHAKCPNLSVP